MGIRGLTTYLRENHRSLSKQLYFDGGPSVTNLVVDAHSFIFELFNCSNLDWVYGGETDRFYRLVVSVVQGWISVGLKLFFVFDEGPIPTLKFDTVMSRLTENNVKTSLLFFRTSSSSRSTPRFLNESRILPPLYVIACIEALQSIARSTPHSLEVHFAPEEGDPYAVELAGKVNGYVTGNDSDFVILNTDGYMGYIPMVDFLWYSSQDTIETTQTDEESDFQQVRRWKKEKKQDIINQRQGIIPPPSSSKGVALSCSSFAPSVLAAHLDIPVTFLPLFGALVGNDFSRNTKSLFFDYKVTRLAQRITRVSNTLRSVITASLGPKRKQKEDCSVIDLIRHSVLALLIRDVSRMSADEQDGIVETIVESTLQYAIPKREESFSNPSGPPCLMCCPTDGLLSISLSSLPDNSTVIRELYNTAYRTGNLFPKIVDVLYSRSFWPNLFLENPDAESVTKTIGRPIRKWLYAILDDGVGLPETVENQSSEPSDQDEGDGESVDVVEEDSLGEELSDPIALSHGDLDRLDGDPMPPAGTLFSVPRKPLSVNEYVRRGTRVTPEEVSVSVLSNLLSHLPTPFTTPVQLEPEPTRFRLLLSILSSDLALKPMQALPQEQVIPVLAIRSMLNTLHKRATNSPANKDHLKEKWTKREVRALLLAFISPSGPESPDGEAPPEIFARHVQLSAQIFTALESVVLLAQVLLLGNDRLPLTLISLFSGRRFHVLLDRGVGGTRTSVSESVEEGVPSELWTSIVTGFESDIFAEDRGKKPKKESRNVKKEQKQTVSASKKHFNGGLFRLLADVEA